jgi:hypothetical protein
LVSINTGSRLNRLIGRENIKDIKGDAKKCRVRTKFLKDDNNVVVENDSNSFLKNINDAVMKMSERMPHRQIVLSVRDYGETVDVVLNPVMGSA